MHRVDTTLAAGTPSVQPHARGFRALPALAGVTALLGAALLAAACAAGTPGSGATDGDATRAATGTSTGAATEPGFTILERAMVDEVDEAYVSYPSGELIVTGRLYVNPFSTKDVEPCVIFNHGGVSGINEAFRKKARWLARQGYIVFAPSYRGEDDSQGEVEVAMGEVDDVLAALAILRDHPGIVPGKFALVGTSHGALVSVKAATRPLGRELVRCVVAAYGVMDIYGWYQYLVENGFDVHDPLSQRIYGDGPKDKPEAFAARHALSLIPQLGDIPIFLVQGAQDRTVPKEQAVTMYRALRDAGRQQDHCRIYEHGAHGFLFWDDPAAHPREELTDAQNAWADILDILKSTLGEPENYGAP